MNVFYKNREIIDYIINSSRLNIKKLKKEILKDLILKISFYKEILIPSSFYYNLFNDDLKREDLELIFEFLINSINNKNTKIEKKLDININYNDFIN